MGGPLEGITVIEVASWMFIPSAGAVLVDQGATVLKIEHPETGDPQRGLIASGLLPGGDDGVNFMIEQPNHGKLSVGIDISTPEGHAALMKLVETADVFLTNQLPHIRKKLNVDTDDIRAVNPDIIIARGSGQGIEGPDAGKAGYDGTSYWARSGMASVMPENAEGWPMGQPAPAFGDVMGGLAVAGAISSALLKRERTGEASIVDVSLMATALWQNSPLMVASKLFGFSKIPHGGDRRQIPNPGVNSYKTGDDRFIILILLQCDKFWEELVTLLDRPEMATDERFIDSAARAANSVECVTMLDEAFAEHDLDYWRERLDGFSGAWTPYQTLDEVYADPQTVANGWLPTMTAANGQEVQLVASPAQFDEQAPEMTRAPDHGEHTDEVLLAAGYDIDQLMEMKISGAIL
jgi:crotonobetainyl-CoA:carnitine CoA-transferase CaiB-like acyl-CoA transferase